LSTVEDADSVLTTVDTHVYVTPCAFVTATDVDVVRTAAEERAADAVTEGEEP
jgi:hypothetical protein